MSVLQKASITSPFGESDECAAFTLTNALETYTLFDVCDVGREYVFSFWIKSAAAGSLAVLGESIATSTAWTEHVIRYVAQSKNLVLDFNAAGTYYIFHAQNELGNQQTDYSEAPEDAEARLEHNIVLTAEGLWETIRSVQSDLTGTTERVAKVEKTAEGITESVTAIEKDQDGMETRLKTAEEQITPERIVQTVRSSAGYQDDRQSIIDQTDEKIRLGIDGIDEFHNTTVDITGDGFALKTGGTFDVQAGASVKIATGGTFELDAPNFDVSADGEINAKNARLSGQLSVDGNNVWHKGEIVLSTVQPNNLKEGMLWVKPDTSSIPAAGTWTHPDLNSRVNQATYDIELSGASIGAAPSNAIYTYAVSVPIFHSYSNENAYKVRVYAGSSLGDKKVDFGEQSFAAKGNHTYEATVTSTQWIGNSDKIYLRIELDNYAYLAVNKGEVFTCTLTAKSNSGGTGWKPCTVQIFMG